MQPLVMMFTFMRIHPGVAVDEIAAALLAWSEDQAYQRIPLAPENARVALRISAHVMDTEQVKALEKASYRKVRRFWRMRIDFNAMQPEPAWPEGINVRNMLPGEERKAIQVLRDAFHDHWGHVDTPFEDEFERWQQMMHSGDWFDPSLWFFAMDGDEIAGFSYCRDHLEGYPDLGWVAQLGVLRPWRQRGLGLALLQHSFAELQRRGRQKVGLAVDTDSITGALRLYEKVGMIPDNQYTVDVFEKELRPGIDFTTH
jgi:mycothiol synthase